MTDFLLGLILLTQVGKMTGDELKAAALLLTLITGVIAVGWVLLNVLPLLFR